MNSDVEFEKIRFLQEAVMMGQFSHPNVLQIYGVIKDEHINNSVSKILVTICVFVCVCLVCAFACEPTSTVYSYERVCCYALLQLMLVTELMTKGDLHTHLKSLKLE